MIGRMILPAAQWLRLRTARERYLILAATVLAAVTLVWGSVVLLTLAAASARTAHDDAVLRLAITQARIATINRLQASNPAAAEGAVATRVQRALTEAGFDTATVVPQGSNAADVTIASARGGAALGSATALEQQGLVVASIAITDNGDGSVAVRMTVRKRG